VHNLAASFVLGYHGCDAAVAENHLKNEPFIQSENAYDWLGSGIYFWEANPDRALSWARENTARKAASGATLEPAVIGAVVDLGFCLDLITGNGIAAVDTAYHGFEKLMAGIPADLPVNSGGDDLRLRKLDCAVVNFLHSTREERGLAAFDTVRGVFSEGKQIYPTAGFREKTHIQICVRKSAMIKGVFRVPEDHFSS
jgi:hypothetical protein